MTQIAHILAHLKSGKTISPLEALELYGCFRLGARIWDLRHGKHDGTRYDIEEIPHEGKQYAVYRLKKSFPGSLDWSKWPIHEPEKPLATLFNR